MPFTAQQFLDIMGRYNEAVWPAQLVLNGLAIGALVLAFRGERTSRWISGILALLWAWTALAYHAAFFRQINPAAALFAALFLAETALFIWYGVIRQRVRFATHGSIWHTVGAVLIAYALLIYPLFGLAVGQRYPVIPTFGLPCPTTIFTFGLLMWSRPAAPFVVWIVPFLWAFLGMQAAIQFDIREDLGLTVAAALALVYWYAQWHATQAHLKSHPSNV